jgi:hypothetical protein
LLLWLVQQLWWQSLLSCWLPCSLHLGLADSWVLSLLAAAAVAAVELSLVFASEALTHLVHWV